MSYISLKTIITPLLAAYACAIVAPERSELVSKPLSVENGTCTRYVQLSPYGNTGALILSEMLVCDLDNDQHIDWMKFRVRMIYNGHWKEVPHPTCANDVFLRYHDPDPGCFKLADQWRGLQEDFIRKTAENEKP